MKISVSMKGLAELDKKLAAVVKDQNAALDVALIEAGFRIQREAKKSIQAHRSRGREYQHGNVTHVASKPGFPPNTDTGLLVNSVYVDAKEKGAQVKTVIVGTDLKYGKWLEFGTTRMAARPWLFPAFEKTRAANINAIRAAARGGFRKAGSGSKGGAA